MANGSKLDKLVGVAMEKLEVFLTGEDHTSKDISEAKIASGILSSWVRNRQTESAREATSFMIARELARDREQLEEYVRLTNPQSPIVKALPKGE